jgi:hypothetical protein
VTGSLGASQVWTNYLNSSGNADIGGAMNIGQSAAIWGAGGLFVAANITANGNITTPGTIQGGYIRSLGSVDADNDLNAFRHVNAQTGRVFGGGGVQTGLFKEPNSWCNWGGGEAGMMAMSNTNGALLSCTAAWQWNTVGGGFEGRFDRQLTGPFWNGAWEARNVFTNPYSSPVYAEIYMPGINYMMGTGPDDGGVGCIVQVLQFGIAYVDGRTVYGGAWIPPGGTLTLQSRYYSHGTYPSDHPFYSGPPQWQCGGMGDYVVNITR